MKQAIQKSSLGLCLMLSSFLFAACGKSPVKFGLKVQDSLGNVIDCENDNPNFAFSAPRYVEAGQIFQLNYGGDTAEWELKLPSGKNISVSGKSPQLKVDEIGELQITASGSNLCNLMDSADLSLESVEPLGRASFTINEGAEYTNSTQLRLKHIVSGATAMKLSNRADCGNAMWVDYSDTSKAFVGSFNAKSKYYMKFKNQVREGTCVEASIIHDDKAPSLEMNGLPAALNNLKSHRIFVKADDTGSGVSSVFCSKEDAAFVPCSNVIDWSNLSEGKHTFKVYAVDKAGNASNPISYQFTSDFTPPVLRVEKKPEQYIAAKSFEFLVSVTDNVLSAEKVLCRKNQESYQDCDKKFLLSAFEEGKNDVYVKAKDAAGNISAEQKISFAVDTLGPAISILSAPMNPSKEEFANFSFTAVDHGIGSYKLYCKLDAMSVVDCRNTFSVDKLSNGQHRFELYAIDALGNRSETLSHVWEVDNGIVNQEHLVEDGRKKIDILMVIDNSSSMDAEQKEMAKRFGTFIQNLSEFDWQIGIITTDASGSNEYASGKLVPFVDSNRQRVGTYVIDSEMPEAEELFKNTIVRHESGNDTEEGIKSIRKFLDREDSLILRDRSHFSTIVISDEDEKSRGSSLDNENKPSHLVNEIRKKYKEEKTYSHHSIIYRPGDIDCERRGGKYEGKTYAQLSNLTNGILGDICAKDYSSQLLDIGDRIKEVSLSIELQCAPRDLNADGIGDVEVKSSVSGLDLSFQLKGSKLLFSKYPPKGTKLNLVYRCNK